MMKLATDVLSALQGKTLVTAESCTGGGVGAVLTAVPGASNVFKGGIISYWSEIKNSALGVPQTLLDSFGAVSAPVAEAMAAGARQKLNADFAVSATGLAGPSGDEFGNPVGTVFIGFADETAAISREFHFSGDRESIRQQAIREALKLVKEMVSKEADL